MCLFKLPFMHESLLLDQKDQKLTRFEKHLAEEGYERAKMMGGRPSAKSHSPPQPATKRLYSPPPPPLLPPFSHNDNDRLLTVSFVLFYAAWHVAVWLSGNALVLIKSSCSTPVSIDVVNHLWAYKSSQYVTIHFGQLSLAIPP